MKHTLSLFVGLLSVGTTVCTPKPPSCTPVVADFAGKEGGVLVGGPPVNVYKSLLYATFQYASASNNLPTLVGGLKFASDPTAIFTSAQTQGKGVTPSLTIQAPYKGFYLQSFYFGCLLPLQNGAAVPATQCTVFVGGFVNNQQVAVATFTFTPPTAAIAKTPMVQAVLPPSFNNLKISNVTIIQGAPLTQVLVVDDARYCLYQ